MNAASRPASSPVGYIRKSHRGRFILWVLAGFWVLVVAGLAWVYWPVAAPPLRIAKDTTYLTGPLNPDGTVNYVAALNEMLSAGVTVENNAAPLLLQAVGPEMIWKRELCPAVLVQLGVSALPQDGAYFITLREYVKRQEMAGPQDGRDRWGSARSSVDRLLRDCLSGFRTGISPDEQALLKGWLAANQVPLELLVQASHRPRFYLPMVSPSQPAQMVGSSCPSMRMGEAGRALGTRALLRVMQGDLEGAWEDSKALHRLAGLWCQPVLLLCRSIAMMLDQMASETDVRIAQHTNLSDTQAQAMLVELQRLPELPSMRDLIDLDARFTVLDVAMQLVRATTNVQGVSQTMAAPRAGPVDYNVVLRRINGYVDGLVEPIDMEDYAERQRLREQLGDPRTLAESRLDHWTGIRRTLLFLALPPQRRMERRSEMVGDWLFLFAVPSIADIDTRRLAATMHRRLAQAAFALAVWHAHRGGYPSTLADLVPDCLPQVPIDVFSGKPLTYSARGAGYLLYSVGINGLDDGGESEGASEADDIVVRMPEARGGSPSQP
jgi:hypothetical protein